MREKNVSMKALVLIMAVVLLFGCTIGGTLAWLMTKTDPVTNKFSAANINITLAEEWNADSDDADTANDIWVAPLIPGTTQPKKATVTVEAGSEACWLFVKVVEDGGDVTTDGTTYTFDSFVDYEMAAEWTLVPGTTNVYYIQVDADKIDADGYSVNVLLNDKVTIPSAVTKSMIEAANANSGEELPTLSFTAYAIQQEGFASPETAWDEAESLG